MKKSTYRLIDIAMLTIFACVLEASNVLFRDFLGELFTVSITVVMTVIVMFRHNGYALIPAALGGIIYCLASKKSAEYFLVYGVGNMFALLNLLWFRLLPKKEESVSANRLLCVLFVLSAFIAVNIGRTVMALPFNNLSFFYPLQLFFFADLLNICFAAIIILIAQRRPAFLKNQYAYLIELHPSKEVQKPTDDDKEKPD